MITSLDTTEAILYQIENLSSARKYITNTQKSLTITNSPNSIKYYGILVLDYIFNTLQKEFPQITDVIVDVGDDHAALFTAKKLGYKNIKYTGNSSAAKIMNTEY
ncbi:hypothetical protein [Candidatus Trichorickettsia mobilis]|uniref:hypothetical protein n=1 Tax=Candidatus Trichorickettsia mobilis TaxID=1346319 RepID=UPI00292EF8F2|nr:hypothetical protein [Candidatus Trichorickettsia mobilis]